MAQAFLNWVWEPWTILWRRPRVPTPEIPQVRLPSPPTATAESAAQLQPQLEQRADAIVTRQAGPTPPSLDLNALLDRLNRRDGSGRGSRYLPVAQQQQAPQVAGLPPTGRRDLAQHGTLPPRAHTSPLYGHSQDLGQTLTLCVQASCIEVTPVFFSASSASAHWPRPLPSDAMAAESRIAQNSRVQTPPTIAHACRCWWLRQGTRGACVQMARLPSITPFGRCSPGPWARRGSPAEPSQCSHL